MRDTVLLPNKDHWSESGPATSVAHSCALVRPHRSVLPFGRLDHAMKAILQRASVLVLALAISVAGCGCASVSAGHRIKPDTISFITPGITTKQEVLENLGSPLFDLEGGRLIAYYWETTGQLKASFFWFGREGGEIGPKQKQWAFCVAFDVSGRVTRRATISTENDETVRDAVLKWHSQTK